MHLLGPYIMCLCSHDFWNRGPVFSPQKYCLSICHLAIKTHGFLQTYLIPNLESPEGSKSWICTISASLTCLYCILTYNLPLNFNSYLLFSQLRHWLAGRRRLRRSLHAWAWALLSGWGLIHSFLFWVGNGCYSLSSPGHDIMLWTLFLIIYNISKVLALAR